MWEEEVSSTARTGRVAYAQHPWVKGREGKKEGSVGDGRETLFQWNDARPAIGVGGEPSL